MTLEILETPDLRSPPRLLHHLLPTPDAPSAAAPPLPLIYLLAPGSGALPEVVFLAVPCLPPALLFPVVS